MNSVKLNKKHLFSIFISLVLLFSLNLNTYALDFNVHFGDGSFQASYIVSGSAQDCTKSVEVSDYVTENDTVVTRYIFPFVSSAFDKQMFLYADSNLYTDSNYSYYLPVSLSLEDGSSCSFSMSVNFMCNGELVESILLVNGTSLTSNKIHRFSGNFNTPDISGVVESYFYVTFRSDSSSLSVESRTFDLGDIVIKPDGPLYGQEIQTANTSSLEKRLGNYDELVGSLPSVDSSKVKDVMNFDFSGFSNGMRFVRNSFENILNALSFNSVILFSLTFGLACLILGRRAGQ